MSYPPVSRQKIFTLILTTFLLLGSYPLHSQATVPDFDARRGITAPAVTSAESDQDLRLNHCFNIGNRDGFQDHRLAARRSHPTKCLTAEAKDHYWLGYEAGFSGTRSYRKDHRSSQWARVRTEQ